MSVEQICIRRIEAGVNYAHLIVEGKLSAEVVINIFHLSCVLAGDDKALIPGSLQLYATAVGLCWSGINRQRPSEPPSMPNLRLCNISGKRGSAPLRAS